VFVGLFGFWLLVGFFAEKKGVCVFLFFTPKDPRLAILCTKRSAYNFPTFCPFLTTDL